MNRIAGLLLGIAISGVISTAAEARDGCGRGQYYDGRRCVQEDDRNSRRSGRDFDDRRDRDDRRSRGREREPQIEFNLGGRRDEQQFAPPNPRYKTWNKCPPNYTVQDGLCKPYTGR